VNAIAPGFIDTALTHELTDSQRDQITRRSALKRMAEAEDVARSVEFLLGSGGRNITGSCSRWTRATRSERGSRRLQAHAARDNGRVDRRIERPVGA